MSKPISLFSGYSQRENRVTNYCLLILKMIYEENPKYLAEVLASLVGEDLSGHVGVSFSQQGKREGSVPDGLIVQRAFSIYIETKNYDWFCNEQLENHLMALSKEVGTKILIALGNFESGDANRFKRIREMCEKQYQQSIVFRAITFEALVTGLAVGSLSKNVRDAVADFREFLNEENLLPQWRDWIDVVNCAGIPEDVIEGGIYMCPAKGGAYTHDRCRYFGMYRNKAVELVAEIEAIVDVDPADQTTSLKWKNIDGDDSDFMNRAKEKVEERRTTEGPARVFLLGPLFETDFRKDSPGGMQASKRYFNIARLKAKNAQELAELLRGEVWSTSGEPKMSPQITI
jgi:hypothetical protein